MRFILCLLVLACGSPPDVPPAAEAPEPAPEPIEPAPTPEPVAPPVLEGIAWMYFETPPANGSCGFGEGGHGPHCDPHYVDDPRVYDLTTEATPRVVRTDGAVTAFDVPLEALGGTEARVAQLSLDGSVLWTAGIRGGDVVVARLDAETGAVGASAVVPPLEGLPATGVRLAASADGLVLHVRAASPWLASLSGDLSASERRPVGVRMDDFAAERDWVPARARAEREAEGDTFVAAGTRVRGAGWTHTIDDPFRCQAYALDAVGSELAVAHHCPATSGAGLLFLDRATGAVVADLYPGTIGSIGHSMYSSRVALARDGDRLYLQGVESAGRYVAIVDASAHRTLAVDIWRR